jgi:hypothetical protein
MLRVIESFTAAHDPPDITVVADAGMISDANQEAIEAAGLWRSELARGAGVSRPTLAASLAGRRAQRCRLPSGSCVPAYCHRWIAASCSWLLPQARQGQSLRTRQGDRSSRRELQVSGMGLVDPGLRNVRSQHGVRVFRRNGACSRQEPRQNETQPDKI